MYVLLARGLVVPPRWKMTIEHDHGDQLFLSQIVTEKATPVPQALYNLDSNIV